VVTWTSSNPRPFDVKANPANGPGPLVLDALDQYADGRGQVLAYATGEESYTDLAGTGYYQTGDPFNQLSEPFLDAHESGAFFSESVTEAGATSTLADWFLDFYGTGAYVPPSSSNPFVGITCSGGTPSAPTTCSAKTLPISTSHTIIMSTSEANIVPMQGDLTVDTSGGVNVSFQVLDTHGNAMPAGTAITYTVSNTNVGSVTPVPPTSVGCDGNVYWNINASPPTFVAPDESPNQDYTASFTASASVTGTTTLNIYVTSPEGTVTHSSTNITVVNPGP
jgi:hypothetical protein